MKAKKLIRVLIADDPHVREALGTDRVVRSPRSCDLSERVLDDRIRRYLGDEPLRLIAQDHRVTVAAICLTVRRHAPEVYAARVRGPKPR